MDSLKVTESEIIEVLLGEADGALETRVRQAVHADLKVADLYAQWAAVLPTIRQETDRVQAMGARVRQGVMERLRESDTINAPLPRPAGGAGNIESDEARRALQRLRSARRWRRVISAVSVAAAMLILIGALLNWKDRRDYQFFAVEQVTGEGLLLTSNSAFSLEEKGMRSVPKGTMFFFSAEVTDTSHEPEVVVPLNKVKPRFPARIQVDQGGRVNLRFPDKSLLVATGPAILDLLNYRTVRQNTGSARYRVAKTDRPGIFTVQVPQGAIQDLGTEFQVVIRDKQRAVVSVESGRIRILPSQGQGIEATEGERAIMNAREAIIEYIPTQKDLAAERARFKTRLIKKGPAPQAWKAQTPPAGVRQVQYPSGELLLKGWVSSDPGDGQKYPAVVYAHGGYAFDEQDWRDTALYQKAGYIVMTPAFRGENGNPGNFECFYGEVDDLVAAGNYLAGLPYVDNSKIFLAGHSIGGSMSILASMIPSPFIAIAAFGGAPNPAIFYEKQGWSGYAPFDARNPRECLLRLAMAFPESVRRPLHMYYGEADTELVAQAKTFSRAAQDKGKPARMWVLKGNHFTSLQPAIAQSIQIFDEMANKSGAEGQALKINYRPTRKVLEAGSNLAAFIQPQMVLLAEGPPPPQLKQPLPFSSRAPLMGVLRLRQGGRMVEALIASEKQPDGKSRIWIDSNLNGDLRDENPFVEGKDFEADQPFAASLGGHQGALRLRRPIRVDSRSVPPRVSVIENRLEVRNYGYLTGEVELKGEEPSSKANNQRLIVLDTNSDGSFDDLDGALGIWTDPGAEGPMIGIRSLLPMRSSALYLGRKWTLAPGPAETFILDGRKLDLLKRKVLQAGDLLPAIDIATIHGNKQKLQPPPGGYLIVYSWSTWCPAGLGDSPSDMNDLYAKFHGRGLVLVGISTDYRKQDLLAYLEKNGIAWPQVLNGPDLSAGIAADLGIEKSPEAILVDPAGRIVSIGQSASEIWSLLEARLPEGKQ